ncbi:class I SAM-dependent methyltransferase [Entomobacter blattae]|uniref:Methyltransferase domain-containing protein n=1 Tax=Entomobacter blattae TaxID=2762277 RepID=A0A7H1NPC0_9PROT|nr:class I SAM-dependent methyltransferase [Entomobacter blattae]QNT77630.1 hypothetical protein JGUZn3_03790 [Entomobacter blattae]
MDQDVEAGLKAQYEAYPYPARNPMEETKRLFIGTPSHLREIDYWVFGAQRLQNSPFRALIAGCGTGDGAIMLAQQLARSRQAEVICLDRSKAALEIARKRAEVRKLDNISFHQAAIEDLPDLNLGSFDYIDCCGVLHHLADPALGLSVLKNGLSPGGGMGLMVYAPYGRTGVYMVQDVLRRLTSIEEPPEKRLDVARRVMKNLPATAWLRFNGNFGDHLTGGDAGLYDLLLNPRDRAYTVDAFVLLLEQAGLAIKTFMEPARYNPLLFLPDARLKERIGLLSWQEQAAMAEEVCGNMATHVVYVQKQGEETPLLDPSSDEAIPIMREMPAEVLAKQIRPDGRMVAEFGTLQVLLPVPAYAQTVLGLIDGVRTVGEIKAILAGRGISTVKFEKIWKETFTFFSSLNKVLLRAPA